ncbi:MAG: hypothetical protein Q8880_03370 [Bacteroidota bacterium]|nr:hypothetical protein [Bacteroidota bacterium]
MPILITNELWKTVWSLLKTVSTDLLKDEKTNTSNSQNNRKSIEYFRWVDLNDLIREIYRNPEQPHHHTEYVMME